MKNIHKFFTTEASKEQIEKLGEIMIEVRRQVHQYETAKRNGTLKNPPSVSFRSFL